MHLPKDGGDGTWYLGFGGMVIPTKLSGVTWNGNEFQFDMEFLGGRMGGKIHARGTVDDAGTIDGKFEFSDEMKARMEEFARNGGDPRAGKKEADDADHSQRRRPNMSSMFQGFKGTRMSVITSAQAGQ
ncbi:hypothetical protein HYR69_05350 [Candidatus Sumerlaeota bacterium]|nr:hypothetical protein [Candidatus Sumerlaeota bacterium]